MFNNLKLIPVEEIKERFNNNDQAFWYFRNVWDSYRSEVTKLSGSEITLAKLNQTFTKHKGAKYYKPLGDFKDFINPEKITRHGIYENWLVQFNKLEFTEEGSKTFKEVSIEHAYNLQDKVLGRKVYSKFELAKALSFMLWRCSEGVILEIEVLKLLQQRFNNETYKVKAAPGWYETYDIDAVMLNDEGKEVMYISIKNLGALSRNTVQKYRYGKKQKNKPMIYMGFNKDNELDFIRPPEWTKQKLQEHLKSGTVLSVKDDIIALAA